MKYQNYQKGKIGEEIAAKFLAKKGFKIIDQNWRDKFGEIDLIVLDKNTLVFVEVKLKIGSDYGSPEQMINKRKISQIQKTAYDFLRQHPQLDPKFPQHRIDAVCIILNKDKSVRRVRHYKNLHQYF